MTPKPVREGWFYQNGQWTNADFYRKTYSNISAILRHHMLMDFELTENTPDYVLKDILLENGFTEYCELLFPESKT